MGKTIKASKSKCKAECNTTPGCKGFKYTEGSDACVLLGHDEPKAEKKEEKPAEKPKSEKPAEKPAEKPSEKPAAPAKDDEAAAAAAVLAGKKMAETEVNKAKAAQAKAEEAKAEAEAEKKQLRKKEKEAEAEKKKATEAKADADAKKEGVKQEQKDAKKQIENDKKEAKKQLKQKEGDLHRILPLHPDLQLLRRRLRPMRCRGWRDELRQVRPGARLHEHRPLLQRCLPLHGLAPDRAPAADRDRARDEAVP